MRSLALHLITLIIVASLFSCDSKSDYIIPKDKMEDVMYDYFIVQGLSQTLPSDKRDMTEKYMEAIFEKHGVTVEQFDSSMVYYFRNIRDMQDIISDLKDRFDDEDNLLKLQGGSNEMRANITLGGDTADIWTGQKVFILRANRFLNKATFVFKADTTFHLNDRFKLVADYTIMREDISDRDNNVTACIAIHYRDGKTVSNVQLSNNGGRFECQIEAIDDREIGSVSGYFLFMARESKTRRFAIIHDISVYRIHTTDRQQSMSTDTLSTDSLANDSAHADSIKKASDSDLNRHKQRLTPEQLRKQNTDNKPDVNIKKAPDVRTPNSVGPRRNIRRNNRK